jgi:hypothetical protein
MCRETGGVKLHSVDEAEFKRAMRSAGTMAPRVREAAKAADADAAQARYGKAVSEDGLEGLFVEIQCAGASRVSRRFVVVDISGSMTPVIPLLDFGPLFASLVGTWLCIVTFGTEVSTVFEGVVSAGDKAPNLVADGTTNLHSALDHVRRKIEADGLDGVYDVVLVTDGEPDDPELSVGAMRALKETGRASVYFVGTGPNYNFDNCKKLLDYHCEDFKHVEPEKVCGALLARGSSVRVRVAGSQDSRMFLNGTVTAPVDGEHAFFAHSGAAHVVFTGNIDLGTMLVDGSRVSARHEESLGYRIRGALLAMTAIARVKKACFELEVPAVARMHTLRHTARELAEHEFPGRPGILEMIEEGKRAIETGAERLRSTATASSVTAVARACTC